MIYNWKLRPKYDYLPPMPGPAWCDAEITTYRTPRDQVGLRLSRYYFTDEMFFVLPECRDWMSIYRGEVKIVGRYHRDWHKLDLVLENRRGYAESASIHFLTAWMKPILLRTFLFKIWREAPVIQLHNTPYRRTRNEITQRRSNK